MTDDRPFCAVRVEATDLTPLAVRLQVEETDERADVARIVFGDSLLVLCDVLHEGMAVEVELGRTGEHAVVFRGIVTSVSAHFPPAGAPTVEVVAHDSLILLSMRPRTRRWANTGVGEIVRRIAVDHGLVAGTVAPGEEAVYPAERPAQQVAETDLAFLERLAQDHDAKLYVDHSGPVDQLCLVSTAALAAAAPLTHSLELNGSLVDFRASFDAWAANPSEELVTTDAESGDRIRTVEELVGAEPQAWAPDPWRLARLDPGDGAVVAQLMTRSASKRAQLTRYWRVPPRVAGVPSRRPGDAHGALGDRLRRRGQTGRGRASGSMWLRPRARVEIVGYGGRWSGVWTLARVRHEVDLALRSYVTTFTCVR